MLQPGRKYEAENGYRYGFNGKENDNEVKGIEGTQQDYGMRIYDPRLGKFLSVDPISKRYPELTPYQFASNRPIDGIDLDGLEFFKKDETNYRMEYKPVVKTPDVLTGVDNACHNTLAFIWNGTIGGLLEASKAGGNYFLAGGYKEANNSPNPVSSFVETTNDAWRYFSRTPGKQILSDFGNEATNLRNYEIIPALVITHKLAPTPPPVPYSWEQLMSQRQIVAREFLTKANVPNIERHMAAIHFERAVFTKTYEKGTVFYRYSEIGTTSPKHYFFMEEGIAPGEVGKMSMYNNPEKYVLEKFTLKKPVKTLNSTTDLGGTAGARQVFSTELEGASTVEQGHFVDGTFKPKG